MATYAPTLTGLGERSHLLSADIDLDLNSREVVAVLHYEDLRDVILVGHSYGGMVITGVVDRAPASPAIRGDASSSRSCSPTRPRPR